MSISSLAVGDPRNMTTQMTLDPVPQTFVAGTTRPITQGDAVGFYDTQTGDLATIAWRSGDVTAATLEERADSVVVRLVLATARTVRITYSYENAATSDAAARRLKALDTEAQHA
ncbi:MAG: hypothetical protein JO060_05020 [Candidatus Eremiobacteraeota bacterium]|nr:hypothetical protein [Candidatus Eremiobacteraeota bacterium]